MIDELSVSEVLIFGFFAIAVVCTMCLIGSAVWTARKKGK